MGRIKKYATVAERQAAYRKRQKEDSVKLRLGVVKEITGEVQAQRDSHVEFIRRLALKPTTQQELWRVEGQIQALDSVLHFLSDLDDFHFEFADKYAAEHGE